MTQSFQKLEKEIQNKLDRFGKIPEYHLKRKKFGSSNITSKKSISEWLIEHPDIQKKLTYTEEREKLKILKEEIEKGRKQVEKAWKFLRKQDLSKNGLNHDLILELGQTIDPNNFSYRNCRVSLNLRGYTPPNNVKIYSLLDNFFDEFNNYSGSNLEKALFAHINIAGIQPFFDGNKRTARMIQNKTLSEIGLPIVTIPPGERLFYVDLLGEALQGLKFYGDQKKHNYRNFDCLFSYLSGKINSSMDQIIESLK